MILKYGKEIDKVSLGRDLEKKIELMNNYKKWAEKCLTEFDSNLHYSCRICESESLTEFVNVNSYHYAFCENCNYIVLLNLPDVEKMYNTNDSPMSDIFLDDRFFLRRAETIMVPKIKFILDNFTPPLKTKPLNGVI
jgi:hypothetical protein